MEVPSNSRFGLLERHDTGRGAARWLPYAGIVALALTIMPRTAQAADQTLLLDVQINGHSIGKIGEFKLRAGTLLARRAELRDLGLRDTLALIARSPASASFDPDALIALSDLPGLTWRLDQKTQTLYITATNDRQLPTLLQLNENERPVGGRVIESGTGVTLNYDVASTLGNGQIGTSAAMDLRAFAPGGVVSSGWLAYAGATSGGTGTNTAVRLDSTYSFADANTLRRYSLGDFITGGLAWTRPIHLEGAQIRSDFSMRPDLVTFPMPSVSGSVAVPSTVNVLADGNLLMSRQIDPGSFQIPQLPVVSGAGTISMTVTNALGQQVNVTQPFYASSALLAPGLQTFSVQAGLVRRNWGSVSNDYGKIAGTAIYRRGLTPAVTVEGSVEGTPGTVMAGAGGVVTVGNLGALNFAAAASTGSGHTGAQLSVGIQRIGRVFSLGASATIADRNYRDVAAINGDPVPRRQLNGSAGVSLGRFGSAGVAYGGIDRDTAHSPVNRDVALAEHSHVISASYSLQFRHMSIYATEFRDLVNKSSGGLQVGLIIPIGRRSSVGASATADGNGQLQVQQSAPQIGDWGYQAYISSGDITHEFVQGQYKSSRGLVTAGVDSNDGQTTLRLETQGALSFVDGGLFPSNTIYDSFAIVDTSPMAHVHVLQENRDVGSTDSAGRLLVPDMRSFDLNRIAIEATDIPPDSTIDVATRDVRPQDRSGVVVRFPVKVSHGALLRLVDEVGVAVPLGSTATLRATGATVPVGYDGEAYLENLSPSNELTVERMDGRSCTVPFEYRPIRGEIPRIGPLTCREEKH